MSIPDNYRAARERYPGMMLLIRHGDRYECFGQDATDLQAVCGVSFTGVGDDAKAGFGQQQLEHYLRKLLHHGKRVAICDQIDYAPPAQDAEQPRATKVCAEAWLF